MFKHFILACVALSTLSCNAQELKDFEGVLVWETFMNQGAVDEDYGVYNGKIINSYTVKGNNVDNYDTRLKVHVLSLIDDDKYIIYSEETHKGIEIAFSAYVAQSKALMSNGSQWHPDVQEETIGTEDVMGFQCTHVKRIEKSNLNGTNSTQNREEWLSSEYKNPLKIFLDGASAGNTHTYPNLSLGTKSDMYIKSTLLKNKYLYTHTKLTEITPRQISPDEFAVPSNVKIKKVSKMLDFIKEMRKVYGENRKALMKKNQYPTQFEDNVVYDTDEEWDD